MTNEYRVKLNADTRSFLAACIPPSMQHSLDADIFSPSADIAFIRINGVTKDERLAVEIGRADGSISLEDAHLEEKIAPIILWPSSFEIWDGANVLSSKDEDSLLFA